MRSRWKLPCLIAVVTIGSLSIQDLRSNVPAVDAHVVRVLIGYSGGMCGGFGYCDESTVVEPAFIVRELKNSGDKKRLPDIKTKRAITQKEWDDLQRSIDAKALKAVPQPATCRSCIDLPESSLVVEYSDGQRIVVSYDLANPQPVAAVLRKIPPIQIRLPN